MCSEATTFSSPEAENVTMDTRLPKLVARYRPWFVNRPQHSDGPMGDGKRRSVHVGGSPTQPGNPRHSRRGSGVPGAGRPGHTTSGWLLPLTQPAIVCARDRGGGGGNVPTPQSFLPVFSSNGLQSFE